MKKKMIEFAGVGLLFLLLLTGCSGTGQSGQEENSTLMQQEMEAETVEGVEESKETAETEELPPETAQSETVQSEPGPATLLYMGQASIRIVTDEGKVIYIDPYAGYNPMHDVGSCVGYVLTFSNGRSVYVTGDTSKTEQMPLLAEKEIDYAFFCCDGVYNMGLDEAAECARLVGAKHNIPYHMTTTTTGRQFDRELAEQFDVGNRLIVEDGEEILIK